MDEPTIMIGCPICGGRDLLDCPFESMHLRLPKGRGVLRCTSCTHFFLWPPYSPEETAIQYDAGYYAHFETGSGMAGDRDGQAAPHLRDRLAYIERLTAGRSLLDVGCAKGSFLAWAAGRGWHVRGIDVSADAVRYVREQRQLPAECCEIDSFDFGDSVFDLIHANHVIEHVRDPLDALRRFARWLRPGGIVAVEVPNEFQNLFFVLGRRLLPASRMVRADPSPHVQFFTPESLRLALQTAGLDVLRLFTARWQVGVGSSMPVRLAKQAVSLVERGLGRGGNIVAIARIRGRSA